MLFHGTLGGGAVVLFHGTLGGGAVVLANITVDESEEIAFRPIAAVNTDRANTTNINHLLI